MLRPAVLLAPLTGLLCHRASTLGSLHQLPVSYEATWLLPRLIFHQLVVPSLARRAIIKSRHTPSFPMYACLHSCLLHLD